MHNKRLHLIPENPGNSRQDLTITLRRQRKTLNNMLRWCSCGLVASFVMIIVAAIPVINELSLKLNWITYLLPGFLTLLFITLVLLEHRYSEKRAANLIDLGDPETLHPLHITLHIADKIRVTAWYLAGIVVIFLLMPLTGFSNHYFLLVAFLIAGLFFYLFGLFLLKAFLKTKCQVRLLLEKPA